VTPLLVAVGALAGAPLRLLALRIAGRGGWGLLGVVLGLGAVPGWVVALVGTGFCGTLTTFSTFGADVVRLMEERALGRALAYLAGTLVLGLGTAAAGYLLSR
jgi:CrcB protein